MDQILSTLNPKYLAIFTIACASLKVVQYVTVFGLWATVKLGKTPSPLALKFKAGLDDVCMNLPASALKDTPVIGQPLKLLAVLAVLQLTACAGIPIESDLISCGSGVAIPAGAGVLSALTGPSNQVETSLEGLALTYGVQSVECVVGDLVAQEEAKLAAAQVGAPVPAAYVAGSLPNLLVIVRGEQHLHGWRLSSGKLVHHRMQ